MPAGCLSGLCRFLVSAGCAGVYGGRGGDWDLSDRSLLRIFRRPKLGEAQDGGPSL